MGATLEIKKEETSLRNTVKHYLRRAKEIESSLSIRPKEWGRFQVEFNAEIDSVFRNIMEFEKANLVKDEKVYKLKQLFINRIRENFLRGDYTRWSLGKPFGYAGDFKIIEDIYENNPITTGFERLFDNYFQMSAISAAVRNRKEDFRRLISGFIQDRQGAKLRIMSLASGPSRELREIVSLNTSLCKNVTFDCYDNDEKALEFAKNQLRGQENFNFFKLNAIRIALKDDPCSIISEKYDLIYSTGLFDYFSEKIATLLVSSLKKILKPGGSMIIANVRDKYSNPSVYFMEWVGDWYLVYRSDDAFREIFINAGFEEKELDIRYEQQGVLQYIIARNKH